MKFKQFKQQLKEVYSRLPDSEQFPSDNELREIPKLLRKKLIKNAVANIDSYLAQLETETNETCSNDVDSNTETASDIDATLSERGSNYGVFTNQALLSQTLKITIDKHILIHGNPELFTDSMNEAIEIICHKLARIANGDPTYDDSWRDISGYATLIVKELNGELI